MVTSIWERIEVDRAEGTPGGWRSHIKSECHTDEDGNTVTVAIGCRDYHAFALAMHPWSDAAVDADARRIARTPDLETLALEGRPGMELLDDIMATLKSEEIDGGFVDLSGEQVQRAFDALAAWRAAEAEAEARGEA